MGMGIGEETEVEEGEALFDREENGDWRIDHEISLSYIEEKLQYVLGNFRKDFEGCILPEYKGSKLNEYGSFLPMYKRSPSCPIARNILEVHNRASQGSPKKLHYEDHRKNSFASSVGNSLKVTPRHAEKSTSECEVVKKALNPLDQRTLKVRIKVGSENLPTKKNNDIYTGLGLVVSPSSSLDDSPITSEGLCDKRLDVPDESPTSILQIMTSRSWGPILSPLSDDLIHLIEKRKLSVKSDPMTVENPGIESSGIVRTGSHYSRSNQEVQEQKKPRLLDKDDALSVELTNHKNTVSLFKKEKEIDFDILGCEEPKFPLLSSSRDTVSVAKGRKSLSTEPTGSENTVALFKKEKETDVDILGCEEPKLLLLSSSQDTVSVTKGRKNLSAEPTGNKIRLVVGEEGLKRASDDSSTGGKRKQKGLNSTRNQAKKDKLVADSTVTSKSVKNSNVSSRDPQKDHYKDFFGDVQSEEEDNESVSGDNSFKRSCSEHHNTSTERHNIESSANPRTQEKYPKVASHVAPPRENGQNSEEQTGLIPSDKEDWVLCEKCKAWRLVPLHINPNSFPEKWICSMLNWLPGMNRCGISDDETTNAVRTRYKQPAPAPAPALASENQHDRLNYSVLNSVGVTSVDARYPRQETVEYSGKKKPGSTNAEMSTHLDGPTHSLNPQKKILQTSGKNSVSLVSCSDKGINLKKRSQRETDLSGPGGSKGIVGEENNLTADNDEAFSTIGRGATSSLSHNASRNDRDTIKNISSGKNLEPNVLQTCSEGMIRPSKSDDKKSSRKRKEKELCSSQNNMESQLMEKMCASEHRKEKKARLSKSGATNSSSSKISGSLHNRTTVQEVKGSPVESVSSSPLRYSNPNTDNGGNDRKRMVKESAYSINDHGTDQSQDKRSHLKKSSFSKNMDPTVSGIDKDKFKTSEFSPDSLNHKHSNKQKKGKRDKPNEKSGTPRKSDNKILNKDAIGGTLSEGSKEQIQKVSKRHDKRRQKDAIGGTLSEGSKEQIQKDSKSRDKRRHSVQKTHEDENLHKKSDRVEVYGNEKSKSLPPIAKVQSDNGLKVSAVDAFNNGDSSKKVRDIEASSPVRRDSSSNAARVLAEAHALKRMGNHLEGPERSGIYFQATLKYLYAASLYESVSGEKSNETYSGTAKLLEFCAREFEKSKDMAAAALAYKCMEVAYLRVVYCTSTNSSREGKELEKALQIIPQGESPSSSASDLDNLNHQANIDKAALAKAIDSPQVSRGHIITSRHRASILRMIDYEKNCRDALEASRKSRFAFNAATSGLGETSNNEKYESVKAALDFSFADVEGFVRLVRIAMEAIE